MKKGAGSASARLRTTQQMAKPLAYLLTWTTYGTWLHGEERPSVDRTNNQYGSPFIEYNPALGNYRKQQLKYSPANLNKKQREIVEETIQRDCEYRNYQVLAISCRSNHIHTVVNAGADYPDSVMSKFKAYATRSLREQGYFRDRKVWTSGGSTRYLFTDESVSRAVEYVNLHKIKGEQSKRAKPGAGASGSLGVTCNETV